MVIHVFFVSQSRCFLFFGNKEKFQAKLVFYFDAFVTEKVDGCDPTVITFFKNYSSFKVNLNIAASIFFETFMKGFSLKKTDC